MHLFLAYIFRRYRLAVALFRGFRSWLCRFTAMKPERRYRAYQFANAVSDGKRQLQLRLKDTEAARITGIPLESIEQRLIWIVVRLDEIRDLWINIQQDAVNADGINLLKGLKAQLFIFPLVRAELEAIERELGIENLSAVQSRVAS